MQLPTRQLGRTSLHGRIRHEQYQVSYHGNDSILRQLWLPPRLYSPEGSTSPPHDSPEVVQYVDRLQNLDDYLHAEITWMQDAKAEAANQRLLPVPVYHVGNEVWLHRRFIRITRPSSKLEYKKLGRFRILEKVSSHAYKLDLPPSMKVHPVFHVSLFEPAFSDPIPGQRNPPPPTIIVDGKEEWLVEKIVSSRIRHRKLQYLVKWIGYDELTWERVDSFTNTNFVEQFHLDHPEDPAP